MLLLEAQPADDDQLDDNREIVPSSEAHAEASRLKKELFNTPENLRSESGMHVHLEPRQTNIEPPYVVVVMMLTL